MISTHSTSPQPSLRLGLMVNVEWVSAILTLRAWFWEKSTSLKYCRITWLGWRSHASVVSAHSFADYADKDSRFCTYAPRAPCRHMTCISARVSPTCNLTVQCNYSQRSAYVEFPCGGLAFRLSLQYASDTYSYHTYCMPTVKNGHAEGGKSRSRMLNWWTETLN